MKKKIVYYTDAAHEDFAGVSRQAPPIPADYPFIHRSLPWRVAAFVVYRLIMTPIAYLYCKLRYHLRVVDKTTGKPPKNQGCYLYGNHTLLAGDAFVPSLLLFPKRVYVLVSPENLATPGTRRFLQMSGAIPLPSSLAAIRSFTAAIEERVAEGHCLTIYPEAHVWPFYTGIRPYPSTAFRFPLKSDAPVYVSTATFHKRRFGHTPQVTVYLDGPFSPDKTVSPKEAEKALRDTVYIVMVERAKNSAYSPIEYRKKERIVP